jgi:hypothetical protein
MTKLKISTKKKVKSKNVKGKKIKKVISKLPALKLSTPPKIPFQDIESDNYQTTNVTDDEFNKIRDNSKKKSDKPCIYWTKDTESSINAYNESICDKEKNRIYETELKWSLNKLIENIFNTFKFSYFETNQSDAKSECLSHLMANISKFKSEFVGKSFGYFSIMAKNHFILINNANYKKWKIHDQIDPTPEHPKEFVIDDHVKYKLKEKNEFIILMVEYWEDNIEKMFSKQRDYEIASAIIELFRQSDRIDFFNKKALYLYIREISGCRTQQITKVINKMKSAQKLITKEYLRSGTILMKKKKVEIQVDEEDDFEKILQEPLNLV